MAWYKTGTVTVTNGSATVTGAGTAFVGSVLAGQGFAAPDGKIYEIDSVVSATVLTLASPYLGATAAGAAYTILPTIGGLSSFATRLDTLLTAMQGVVDGAGQGKFAAGTPAAPGMRFLSDGDTGFTNPAANQIGMVAGGVLRALLSSTAFNLSVPLTGTAVTQTAIDTTAGRLLKAGDFGIGVATDNQVAALRIEDASVDLPSGFFSGPGSSGTNYPTGKARFSPFINMLRRSSAGAYRQTRLFFSGPNPVVGEKDSSGPWAFSSVFTTNNLLGTVSQAAGVPTGAIIERDSNANGDYTRYADGTQICNSVIVTDATLTKTWTFPAAFVAAPTVVGSSISTVLSAVCLDAAPSATSVSFRTFNKTDAQVARTCHMHAIGRWF